MRDEPEVFEASCLVCGRWGEHRREEGRPLRETYKCAHCQASLRYRAQAEVVLRCLGGRSVRSIAELVDVPRFRSLVIYEPGFIGPFRRYFRGLRRYTQSRYEPGRAKGERLGPGLENQDLMDLTFADDQFDLVISSDIFEHVRKPLEAFSEVHRVLKKGGMHIFSIPFSPRSRGDRLPRGHIWPRGCFRRTPSLPRFAGHRSVAGVHGLRTGHAQRARGDRFADDAP